MKFRKIISLMLVCAITFLLGSVPAKAWFTTTWSWKCSKCGKENSSGYICSKCGAEINKYAEVTGNGIDSFGSERKFPCVYNREEELYYLEDLTRYIGIFDSDRYSLIRSYLFTDDVGNEYGFRAFNDNFEENGVYKLENGGKAVLKADTANTGNLRYTIYDKKENIIGDNAIMTGNGYAMYYDGKLLNDIDFSSLESTGTSVSALAQIFLADLGYLFDNHAYVQTTVSSKIEKFSSKANDTNAAAVTAMVGVAGVYEFYQNLFGRKGPSGDFKRIEIWVNDSQRDIGSGLGENSYATSFMNSNGVEYDLIVLGYGEGMSNYEVIGHELTHRYFEYIVRPAGDDKEGIRALNEGFADVMGSLFFVWLNADTALALSDEERLNSSGEWAYQRAIDPLKDDNPVQYKGENWKSGKEAEEHGNSTVISHAAYLMTHMPTSTYSLNEYEGLTYFQLAHLYYETMMRMPSDCNYPTCAEKMREAAALLQKDGMISARQAAYVDRILDDANLPGDLPDPASVHTSCTLTGTVYQTLDGTNRTPCKGATVTFKSSVDERRYTATVDLNGQFTIDDLPMRVDYEVTIENKSGLRYPVLNDTLEKWLAEQSEEERKLNQQHFWDGERVTYAIVSVYTGKEKVKLSVMEPMAGESEEPVDYEYTLLDDATIEITGYTGTDTEISIPATIDGYPVTRVGDSAFRDCSGLTSITIPDSVTHIGDSAFYGCSSLTSITMPDSVTYMGYAVFNGCSSLTSITIPDGVTRIDDGTFYGCSSLTSITIPDGVAFIGNYAFYNCSDLTSITMPDSLTLICMYAFSGCSSLTSITIPDGVTTIGGNAFNGCNSLMSVTMPDSLMFMVDSFVFSDCSSLTSITIPDGVMCINNDAFSGCSSLTSITIPDSVTSIGYNAFSGCSGLTSITIPISVTEIDNCAFDGCSNLTIVAPKGSYAAQWGKENGFDVIESGDQVEVSEDSPAFEYKLLDDATIEITGYNGTGGEVTIPATIDGYPVTSIGYSAFSGCSSLTSITIPDGVTRIGTSAFIDCSGLTSITIPDSVTSIDSSAFSNCSGLTSIKISKSVTRIDNSVFSGCSSLTMITIPDSVTYIDDYAFDGCSGLTSITIPDSVKYIGAFAFSGCSDLTSITIPDGVTSIAEYTFIGCSSLASIAIPDSVTYIDEFAFSDCVSLTLMTIPDGVTIIHIGAFSGCTGLTSITIPDSVTSIGDQAFSGCSSLTIAAPKGSYAAQWGKENGFDVIEYFQASQFRYIVSSSGITIIGYSGTGGEVSIPGTIDGYPVISIGKNAFYSCKSLTSITIPGSVTSIGDHAFYECSRLSSVTLQDGVIIIGDAAFACCHNMTTITIPDSVTSIGDYAFAYCNALKSITIPDSVTSIGDYAFYRCYTLSSITLPNSITSISNFTFWYCWNLTSITIPDSVTSIGFGAFCYCRNLDSITIPDSVTSIDASAFASCDGLTSLTLPDSLTTIGNSAFYGCSKLESITLPDSLTSIGEYAFYGCHRLTSITIPNGLTSIAQGTFEECSGLTSITIPNSVTDIEGLAFYGCRKLTTVYVESKLSYAGQWGDRIGLEVISNATFEEQGDPTDFYYRVIDYATITITGYKGEGGNVSIPATIEGLPVTIIGDSAFRECYRLKSITIPDNVTKIGETAFFVCRNLTSITLPDSLTIIDSYAFCGCSSLTSITIPDGVTRIKEKTFYQCSSLTSVALPEGLTSIDRNAFCDCSSLTSITIPGSVTSIGDFAFYGCSSLTSVALSEGLTSIDRCAFSGCSSMTSIILPDGLTSIGEEAFNGCCSLTSITLPDGLTSIGEEAFMRCRSLTSITLPDSLTSIGYSAFWGCSDLTIIAPEGSYAAQWGKENGFTVVESSAQYLQGSDMSEESEEPAAFEYTLLDDATIKITGYTGTGGEVIIPATIDGYPVTSIGYSTFSGCSSLTSITIPDGVTRIGTSAFIDCSGLTSITIPDSVEYIGYCAFYGCSGLTSITIPDSVTSIDSSAFSNCSRLTSITIPKSVTSIDSSVFSGCSSLMTITIPDSVTYIDDYAFEGCGDLTIVAPEGSYAVQWGKENGYKTEIIGSFPDGPDSQDSPINEDSAETDTAIDGSAIEGPAAEDMMVFIEALSIDDSFGEEDGVTLVSPATHTIRWQASDTVDGYILDFSDAAGNVLYRNELATDTTVLLDAQNLQKYEVYRFEVTPVTKSDRAVGKEILIKVVDQEWLDEAVGVGELTITIPDTMAIPPDKYVVFPGTVTVNWHADGAIDHYTLQITDESGVAMVQPYDFIEETTTLDIPDFGSERRFVVSITAVPQNTQASSATASLTLLVQTKGNQIDLTSLSLMGSELSSMEVLFIGDQITYGFSKEPMIREVSGKLTYNSPDRNYHTDKTLTATYSDDNNAYISFFVEAEGKYDITFIVTGTNGVESAVTKYDRTFLAVKPVASSFDVYRHAEWQQILLEQPGYRNALDIIVDEQTPLQVIGEYGTYYYVVYTTAGQSIRAFVSKDDVGIYDHEINKRAFIMIGASMGAYWADEGGYEDVSGALHSTSTWFDLVLTEQLFGDVGCEIITSDKKTTKSALNTYLKFAAALADDDDITYIYIAAHGGESGVIELADGERMRADDLCDLISRIKGKVNVFMDSCYTGGYLVSYAEDHSWDKERYCIITTGGYDVTVATEGGTRWFNIAYDASSTLHRVMNGNRMTLGYFYERTQTVYGGHELAPMGSLVGSLAELITLVNQPLHYGNDNNILFDFNK